MNGYSIVSLISLCCYLLMFTTFLAARKSQRIVRSFLVLLAFMILWSWGSLFMRTEQFPSPFFWHQVSIFGLLMLPAGYYSFFGDFVGVYNTRRRLFWRIVFLALFVVNYFTEFMIPLPEITHQGSDVIFQYHYTNWIYLVFFFMLLVAGDIAWMVMAKRKKDPQIMVTLRPLILGICILFLGHFLSTIPFFLGVPMDIVSGVVNAMFFIYALYKKQIFRVTMLISKENCYLISLFFGILLLSNVGLSLQRWLSISYHLEPHEILVIVGIGMILLTIVLYLLLNSFLNNFFLQDEQMQSSALADYSSQVTQLLRVREVFETLNTLVQNTLKNWSVIGFCLGQEQMIRMAYSSNPLDAFDLHLDKEHPLVLYLNEVKTISRWEDFKKTSLYRGVWENEKQIFASMHVQFVAPLFSENHLIGILFFNSTQDQKPLQKDFAFLQSILAVTSVALNNAQKYERAYMEARMDEDTGVYNRKYFHELLEEKYNEYKDSSLALAIANLDDFRLYNQLYGQKEGDLVLRVVAHLLKTAVADQGYVARIAGKEFGVILPGYDILSAKTLMEKVLEQLQSKDGLMPFVGHVTFSAGVCASPYLAGSCRELLSNTEMAVSGVKRSGKNGVQMYSEEIRTRMTTKAGHHSQYDMYASTIYALTAAIDAKDHYTFSHSQNVAYYAKSLAHEMHLSEELENMVYEAGLLHDIGKIGISEYILNKPGRLNSEEYEEMKRHVENAVDIIRHLPAMEYVVPAVISHHERYDGTGYPRRLKGEDIPLLGRILCVVDSFDAMISKRSYKKAMSVYEALQILDEQAGRQFDPHCVDAFIRMIQESRLQIRYSNQDTERE